MKNKNVGTIKIGGINESGEEERREEKRKMSMTIMRVKNLTNEIRLKTWRR